jgi:hypothetical protein
MLSEGEGMYKETERILKMNCIAMLQGIISSFACNK